ncbi:four helix bundle protein [Rheinheimera baltica]|uniref:Four helix bundle protein n=1 Tax=Rheinheimera baltica TaxID=67576 RepID=A0ABT9I1S3_9GAMM|nr:four helix bundle protein [Rheinheimera baltica]MDP5137337.1 four helix bundle protein [Rheinheimera baltica]
MTQRQGPRYKSLPVWRDATRFMVEIELAVKQFPRYHKYTLGSELRQQAMSICRLVARAGQANELNEREQCLKQLVWQVEDLKVRLQLAKELEAFASFAQFQRLAEQAVALGKQSGGWWKRARSAVQASSYKGEVRA